MKNLMHSCTVLAASAVLIGCGTGKVTSVDPTQVNGKTWVLAYMDDLEVKGPKVTLQLVPSTAQDGTVFGQGQCNQYFGSYQVENGKIHFDPMGGTDAACPAPFMTVESEYLASFPKVDKIAFKANQMSLTGDDAHLVYIAETAVINGQITTKNGQFPMGSEVVVALQNMALADNPSGLLGAERILVEHDTDTIRYSIRYAPEMVDPEARYELVAEVLQNGHIAFAQKEKPSIHVHSLPKLQHKKAQ